MLVEFNVVLRNNHKESLIGRLNFTKFKNLFIIIINFTCECKWSDVNEINFRILTSKDSWDLWVFSMFEFIHCWSFPFIYWNAVYVNFNSSFWFNLGPFGFELIHHVLPFKKRLLLELFNFKSCVFLELVKTIFSLNDSCFCH